MISLIIVEGGRNNSIFNCCKFYIVECWYSESKEAKEVFCVIQCVNQFCHPWNLFSRIKDHQNITLLFCVFVNSPLQKCQLLMKRQELLVMLPTGFHPTPWTWLSRFTRYFEVWGTMPLVISNRLLVFIPSRLVFFCETQGEFDFVSEVSWGFIPTKPWDCRFAATIGTQPCFFFFVIRWQLNWVHFDISMYKMYNELSLNLTVINFQDFTGVMFRKKDYMFVLENVSVLVTYL